MTTLHPDPVPSQTTHLQPDGTVFPPVTPDPPAPPGYVSPVEGIPDVEELVREADRTDGHKSHTPR
jgi:hypothetical protein